MSDKTKWKERGRDAFDAGEDQYGPHLPLTAPENSWFREGWKEAEAEFLENEKADRDRITDEERELMKEEEGYEPTLKVVPLYETNFRSIPDALRNIADEIEAGTNGDVNDCVVVTQGATFEIYHTGKGNVETAHLLLGCASRKIENAVLDHYEQ